MNSGGNNKNNSLGLNNYDQQDTSYNTYGLSPSFLASLRIQGPLHNKVFVANVSILRQMLYNQSNSPNKSLFFSSSLFTHTLSLSPPHLSLYVTHSLPLSLFLSAVAPDERRLFCIGGHLDTLPFCGGSRLSLVVPFSSVEFLANNSIR